MMNETKGGNNRSMKAKPVHFRGYSADTTDAQAREWFEKQYGYLPAEVIRTGGAVLAGPIRPVSQ